MTRLVDCLPALPLGNDWDLIRDSVPGCASLLAGSMTSEIAAHINSSMEWTIDTGELAECIDRLILLYWQGRALKERDHKADIKEWEQLRKAREENSRIMASISPDLAAEFGNDLDAAVIARANLFVRGKGRPQELEDWALVMGMRRVFEEAHKRSGKNTPLPGWTGTSVIDRATISAYAAELHKFESKKELDDLPANTPNKFNLAVFAVLRQADPAKAAALDADARMLSARRKLELARRLQDSEPARAEKMEKTARGMALDSNFMIGRDKFKRIRKRYERKG